SSGSARAQPAGSGRRAGHSLAVRAIAPAARPAVDTVVAAANTGRGASRAEPAAARYTPAAARDSHILSRSRPNRIRYMLPKTAANRKVIAVKSRSVGTNAGR